MSLGIIIALPEELRSLTSKKLKQGECITLPNNIVVILSGAGADNAKKAATTLLAQGVKKVISWGCAGALSPDLKAGDLVIPEYIQDHLGKKLNTHTLFRQNLLKLLTTENYFAGGLLESTSVLADSTEKIALFDKYNTLAVDMESAAIAHTAKKANIPFIAIRSIVDSASFSLPKAITYAVNEQGFVNHIKLICYIICHPYEIPRLIQLGRHFNLANKRLAKISPLLAQVSSL